MHVVVYLEEFKSPHLLVPSLNLPAACFYLYSLDQPLHGNVGRGKLLCGRGGPTASLCLPLPFLCLSSLILVVDCLATVLWDDLADGVGGGAESVVGEAVGKEHLIEVGHQGRCELGLGREEVEGGRFCISLCRSSPALFSSAIVLVCPCTITITTHHPQSL